MSAKRCSPAFGCSAICSTSPGLLARRLTRDRENMTSDGTKTVFIGARRTESAARQERYSGVSPSYARLSEKRAWPIGPRRARSLIVCGTEALNLGYPFHTQLLLLFFFFWHYSPWLTFAFSYIQSSLSIYRILLQKYPEY